MTVNTLTNPRRLPRRFAKPSEGPSVRPSVDRPRPTAFFRRPIGVLRAVFTIVRMKFQHAGPLGRINNDARARGRQ